MRRLRALVLCGSAVLAAASAGCSRGAGSRSSGESPGSDSEGASSAGEAARGTSSEADLLLEGAGLPELRIDEATVADAESRLGLSTAPQWMRTFDNGLVELRTPQLVRLSFLPPEEGEGPARLYAVRVGLWEPIYTGKTSKGIGLLDTLDAVTAAYGPSDAEWVSTNERRHYYAQQGVVVTTRHPKEIQPQVYAQACAVLEKQPDDGPHAAVVTAILVVPPFTVTKGAEVAMARQQVISTRPETTLRISEF